MASDASMEIARKFQRALRNRDFSEVDTISLDDLIFAKAELSLDRNMEYYSLLLQKLNEKEREKNIRGSVLNISNSAIGVLNTGEIEDVNSISVNVSFLNEQGKVEIASALENMAQAVVASKEMTTEKKEEALELLETISGQAALSEEKRLKPGAIRAIFDVLTNIMSAGGGLAEVWTTWGSSIKGFFGI